MWKNKQTREETEKVEYVLLVQEREPEKPQSRRKCTDSQKQIRFCFTWLTVKRCTVYECFNCHSVSSGKIHVHCITAPSSHKTPKGHLILHFWMKTEVGSQVQGVEAILDHMQMGRNDSRVSILRAEAQTQHCAFALIHQRVIHLSLSHTSF